MAAASSSVHHRPSQLLSTPESDSAPPAISVRPSSPMVSGNSSSSSRPASPSSSTSSTPSASRLRRGSSRSCSLTVADFTSRWKEVFGMFDENLDGVVTTAELGSKMRSLGYNATQTEVEDLLHEWDKDDKGALTLTEFTLMMNSSRFGRQQTGRDTENRLELKAAFDMFDRDKNGVLDAEEVKTALKLLGEEATDELVAFIMLEADANKDGVISFKEFCNIVGGLELSPQSPFFFHGKSALRRRREEQTVKVEYQTDERSTRTS